MKINKHNTKSNYPPNRDTVTFELKGFDQNNLAGVLLHQIATFCVKMRMICAVMHEWAHIKGKMATFRKSQGSVFGVCENESWQILFLMSV